MSLDVITHSEVRRLAQSLEKGMGLQLRSRPVWGGTEQLQQEVRLGGHSPYRLAPKSNPDYAFERICHNGEVYAASQIAATNSNYIYTSPDLKIWTLRSSISGILGLVSVGRALWFSMSSSSNGIYLSTNDGIGWTMPISGYFPNLCSAGMYGYGFYSSYSTNIILLTEAGQWTTITLPESRLWKHAVYNGKYYVIFDQYCDRAYASLDGKTNWKSVAGLDISLAEMPSNYGNAAAVRQPFEINQRFVIIDYSGGGVSTIISEDGMNWSTGAKGINFGNDNFIIDASKYSSFYRGSLYTAVRLYNRVATDIGKMALLETRDGIRFRLLPSFSTGRSSTAETVPGVYAKADGSGIIFNASASNMGSRYEIDSNAKEIYCAL